MLINGNRRLFSCLIMQIVTPKALLRNWRPDDAESLVKHADNPKVASTLRDAFPSPYTLEDARWFIGLAAATSDMFLAIEVGGEAAGGIGIHVLNDVKHRSAEIGYWLAEPYWGKGIVTDAVIAIVPVAFRRYDIVRLQAGIFSNNPASMRVLEKCGFAREAVHRDAVWKNGRFLDEVMYVRFR